MVRAQRDIARTLDSRGFRVLLASCALLACSGTRAKQPDSVPAPPVVESLVLPGTVESPSEARRLSFGRSGRIARIDGNVGDSVRRGQVLAVLECSDVKAELAALEAEWDLQQITFQRRVREVDAAGPEVARDRLALADADLRAAEATQARLESVSGENKFFSRHELESATRSVIVARLAVSTAKEALDRLQNAVSPEDEIAVRERIHKANISRARYQLSLCKIVSPVDGSVTANHKVAGELTAAFGPIITVVDDTNRLVSVCIPQTATDRVQIGQRLLIQLPAVRPKPISAVISRMNLPAASAVSTASCTPCPVQAWLEPVEKLSGVPLHSLAYVHIQ